VKLRVCPELVEADISRKPLQINFDLLFQAVAAQWRLYGIAISTPEAVAAQSQAQAQARDRSTAKKQ
jgi:hypothetical protein